VNRFAKFNNFVYRPKVNYKDKIYSFPINLLTISQVYPDVITPTLAKVKLFHEALKHKKTQPTNLEEYCLYTIGKPLYDIFIKGYTQKQWGRCPTELPASIVKRIPIRFNFDDNYFNDKYQGIPIGGYTQMIQNMLKGIEVILNHDFLKDPFIEYNNLVYTGPVDEFYDYKFGKLEYRSLEFSTQRLDVEDYQGNAVINYTHKDVPYTRITEHKHFESIELPFTVITKEYPTSTGDPYYPINNEENDKRYSQYKTLMNKETNIFFGGRLADYKYYDMHQVIGSALSFCKKIC
jgi:UDP-galactopyranose mutase